jgi:DNA-binding XRE family transcriptional regulator
MITSEQQKRFWSKVAIGEPDECWEWKAGKARGYGVVGVTENGKSKNWGAHQLSYHLVNGVIPKGHVVRHTCDSKGCVNPAHLINGTPQENSIDAALRNRFTNQVLTPDDVQNIRALVAEGRYTQKEIADFYGVTHTAIYAIRTGRSWSYLKPFDLPDIRIQPDLPLHIQDYFNDLSLETPQQQELF